ncbi:hypothetical protein [Aliiroseovarius sp. YM-037]|uniref:hypothetical protein n=1 Tax=Aliiroseovarius sp. YM-037 TaxID=3341728 RepID=UPI003A81128C
MTFSRYAVLLAAALVLGAKAADADQMLFPRLEFAPWVGAEGNVSAAPANQQAVHFAAPKSNTSTQDGDDE